MGYQHVTSFLSQMPNGRGEVVTEQKLDAMEDNAALFYSDMSVRVMASSVGIDPSYWSSTYAGTPTTYFPGLRFKFEWNGETDLITGEIPWDRFGGRRTDGVALGRVIDDPNDDEHKKYYLNPLGDPPLWTKVAIVNQPWSPEPTQTNRSLDVTAQYCPSVGSESWIDLAPTYARFQITRGSTAINYFSAWVEAFPWLGYRTLYAPVTDSITVLTRRLVVVGSEINMSFPELL